MNSSSTASLLRGCCPASAIACWILASYSRYPLPSTFICVSSSWYSDSFDALRLCRSSCPTRYTMDESPLILRKTSPSCPRTKAPSSVSLLPLKKVSFLLKSDDILLADRTSPAENLPAPSPSATDTSLILIGASVVELACKFSRSASIPLDSFAFEKVLIGTSSLLEFSASLSLNEALLYIHPRGELTTLALGFLLVNVGDTLLRSISACESNMLSAILNTSSSAVVLAVLIPNTLRIALTSADHRVSPL